MDIAQRIQSLDIKLFEAISSQTSEGDKISLLYLQRCARGSGNYTYLEIGSHLGGSLQPFYQDPLCTLIYSIDKRPLKQPDERGIDYHYPENSSQRMVTNLLTVYPGVGQNKLKIFDCNAADININQINVKPNLCFIDGEHTNKAVLSDFDFCFNVCDENAMIAFHDANYVFKGINQIKKILKYKKINFLGLALRDNVYVILLNKAKDQYSKDLKPVARNEQKFALKVGIELFKIQFKNKFLQKLKMKFVSYKTHMKNKTK